MVAELAHLVVPDCLHFAGGSLLRSNLADFLLRSNLADFLSILTMAISVEMAHLFGSVVQWNTAPCQG